MPMGFHGVAFPLYSANFAPHFSRIMVVLGLPYVTKQWSVEGKSMLPVSYHHSKKFVN